ncbi:small multi-drug export protein [Halopiger goleimassiliensis]|uniref:small multi-drug export protein n=1 Tax=Halopiger goleimassiliensis TaxID=1293048 RepID=UPI0006776CD5|nr:small multi-drug export protein [Halopiger goleimassiliensis]
MLPATLLEVGTTIESASGLGRYVLVFLLAMIPAIEPFIVIPIAIGLGLDPVGTGTAAFAGSVTAVAAIVYCQQRLAAWWSRRRDPDEDSSDRYGRARRVWRKYGMAGLAFAGPILAGIHLTALLAAVTGRDARVTVAWLSVGLLAWTVALVAGTTAGISVLGLA